MQPANENLPLDVPRRLPARRARQTPDYLEWDFFIAHASADSEVAERLRGLLAVEARVFDDSMLPLGVEWDVALGRHLRASTITVVLVSSRTFQAYYQREEIAMAIEQARRDPDGRRVVPVYLEAMDAETVPYGLAIRSSLQLSTQVDLPVAARRLLSQLQDMRRTRREGPYEAAGPIADLLLGLDKQALSGGDHAVLRDAISDAVMAAGSKDAGLALRNRLRRIGIDPRAWLPPLRGHAAARSQWLADPDLPAEEFLSAVRRQLVRQLAEETIALGDTAAELLWELLAGRAEAPDTVQLIAALDQMFPPLRSTSTEAVLVRMLDTGSAPAGTSWTAVSRAATGKYRLPEREPFTVGRDQVVAEFAGRIRSVFAERGRATAFVSGQVGAGTSVVAKEVARTLAPEFPGGAWYVNLKGLDDRHREELRVVARQLCYGLGVEPSDEEDAAFEDCRDAMADRSILLLLDDALDAEHVSHLLSAPASCVVIVTSRDRDQDFADPELVYHVPPLTRQAAIELLTRFHARTEPPDITALDRIAQSCDDLPLALRIVANWLAARPDMDANHVAGLLEDERTRLGYLERGRRPFRAAIELSYRFLDDPTRRAFRFITAVPGAAVTAVELGGGLEVAPERMELQLHRLVDRSVASCQVVADQRTSTFRLFELVRLFAWERLQAEDSPEVIRRFRRNLITHLLKRLQDMLDGDVEADLELRLDPTRLESALRTAEDEEWLDLAASLAENMRRLYELESDKVALRRTRHRLADLHLRDNNPQQAIETYLALAAEPSDDRTVDGLLGRARQIAETYGLVEWIGRIAFEVSKRHAAREDWAKALAAGADAAKALTAAGKRAAALPVVINNARLAINLDDGDAALLWSTQAVALQDARTSTRLRADAAYEHARALGMANRVAEKLKWWREAATHYVAVGNFGNAGLAAYHGALAAVKLSAYAEAAELCMTAADHHRKVNDRNREVEALIRLSGVYAAADQPERALDVLTDLLARVPADQLWHRGVMYEVAVRRAVMYYVVTGVVDLAQDLAPAIATEQTESDEEAFTSLRSAVNALHSLRHSRHGRKPTQAELRKLIERPMLYSPPPHRLWMHTELGHEPPSRLELI